MPIQVEHLTHTYLPGSPFSATAIHDITLTIEDGEFIGVLGHTGSGKTTLVQHLNGLLKPSEGRVVVDGTDITQKGVSLLAIRKQVGLVFQYPEYQLFEETVEKDIAFGPKNMGLSAGEVKDRVLAAMDMVGLSYEEIGQKSPFELSGGQMRRVALAGVLAMQPRILVLDEPTAGLDPRARKFLLEDIQRLHREGTTVVMISHSMDDVAQLATRIAVMEKGQLAMTGTPEEIFSQYDRLTGMGLDVPQASVLSHRLRGKGLAIDNCYQLSCLADELEKPDSGRSAWRRLTISTAAATGSPSLEA